MPNMNTLPSICRFAVMAGALLLNAALSGQTPPPAARVIDAVTGQSHETIRAAIRRTLDLVHPIAQQLGDTDALAHVDTILERGAASARMRVVYAQQGSMTDVAAWMRAETLVGTGLDRRHLQRAP